MRLIVGVDPGTKVGLAIFDLRKNLICTNTIKGGIAEIVRQIAKCGTPAIVACDRSIPPALVRKIATCFGAKVYAPRKSLSTEQKTRLTKKHGLDVHESHKSHERDAMAAALAFFAAYKNKFAWIERIAREHATSADELKYLALIGVPIKKLLR